MRGKADDLLAELVAIYEAQAVAEACRQVGVAPETLMPAAELERAATSASRLWAIRTCLADMLGREGRDLDAALVAALTVTRAAIGERLATTPGTTTRH